MSIFFGFFRWLFSSIHLLNDPHPEIKRGNQGQLETPLSSPFGVKPEDRRLKVLFIVLQYPILVSKCEPLIRAFCIPIRSLVVIDRAQRIYDQCCPVTSVSAECGQFAHSNAQLEHDQENEFTKRTICVCFYLFIYSFIHSFIDSFIYSFIYVSLYKVSHLRCGNRPRGWKITQFVNPVVHGRAVMYVIANPPENLTPQKICA
jgi:hypothetical protein